MKHLLSLLFLLLSLVLLGACASPHTHTWSQWQVTKSPSCIETGEQYRTCDCGEIETAPLPVTQDHVAGDWEITTPATQTQDGMKIKQCIYCDAVLEHAIIPAWEKNDTLVTYTIHLNTLGGNSLSGVTIDIYADEALTDFQATGRTNAKGQVQVALPEGEPYWAVLKSGVPEGYQHDASYPLTSSSNTITLTSSVIVGGDTTSVFYTLGDIIHDFTVTDCEGNQFTLSEVLQTKEMVLINFWYINCSWCVKEFPYMQSVYEEYEDQVAIIALNPNFSDTTEQIKAFKEQKGITFPMAHDTANLNVAFGDYIWGYPTSVVIDRYGMICMAECGGIVSEEPFRALFDFFTGDDYTQTIIGDINELLPTSLSLSAPETPKQRKTKKA